MVELLLKSASKQSHKGSRQGSQIWFITGEVLFQVCFPSVIYCPTHSPRSSPKDPKASNAWRNSKPTLLPSWKSLCNTNICWVLPSDIHCLHAASSFGKEFEACQLTSRPQGQVRFTHALFRRFRSKGRRFKWSPNASEGTNSIKFRFSWQGKIMKGSFAAHKIVKAGESYSRLQYIPLLTYCIS